MPDDSKNKLAGMIALKQKDVVKTPPKPAAAAPPKPKEPPKPKAMDKLMAARGQVQVTKVAKKPDPPAKPAPKAPPVAAKKMEAALAGVKVVSGKAAGTKSAASAPQAAVKAATQKPKKTPAPRKPSGPGAFTRMVETLKVHIREEIQEIKKELAAQHLFKPFKDGLNSMKKGVSYLKERISEDKSAAGEALKSAYQDVREARKLQVFDRSDPNADIASVAEERQKFGAAFEQLGSIRQRQAPHPAAASPQDESPSEGGSTDMGWPVARAEPGDQQRVEAVPRPSGFSPEMNAGTSEGGDIAPVAEERRQAQAFGAALEQLGAIRQREAASHRTRPQDQQQEASADASARPSAEVAAASGGASPASGASPEGQPLRAESSPKSGPEMDRGVAPVAEERRGPAQQASGPPPEARLERAALPRPGPEAVGDIAPVAEERRQAAQMGAALEQLGAIRQREAAARRAKVPGQQQAAETPAEGSARPPAEATAASQGTSPQATEPLPAVAQPARVEEGLERAATPSPGPEPGVEEAPSVPSEAPPALTPVQEMRDASEGPSLLQRLMGSQKTAKKKGGVQRKASKTEHQIRAIKALQALFRHPLWRRVILDPAEKPSQVYIPRKTFEANFAEAEFRNAMRAASRLAMGFWADIKELTFDERTIEEVLTFEFPKVRGQEDPDEKQIAEKCDKETAQRIERFVESDEVRLLLRNSGTRLGTFVPSMEIIARIYLSLKKGSDMNPAARLDIQKDVMFKYQKAKYPEKLARRARNVALRYFFEYLIDYGLELYRERKAALMEMKMPDGDREGRFEALREVCCNLAAERASKAVLSAQIILELREQIRGAINDYEMGVEPGAGGKAALTAEEEEEEEAPEQSANPPEEQPKEPSEPVSQT